MYHTEFVGMVMICPIPNFTCTAPMVH